MEMNVKEDMWVPVSHPTPYLRGYVVFYRTVATCLLNTATAEHWFSRDKTSVGHNLMLKL